MSTAFLPLSGSPSAFPAPWSDAFFQPVLEGDPGADDAKMARRRAAYHVFRAGQQQLAAMRSASADGGLTAAEIDRQTEHERQAIARQADGERLRQAAAEQLQSDRLGLTAAPAAASPVCDPHDPFRPRAVMPDSYHAALARSEGRPAPSTDVHEATAAVRGPALVEHRNGVRFADEAMSDTEYCGETAVMPSNVAAAMGRAT